jgi:hypothetical protein
VRAVVRTLGATCPLFCVADDHAHAVVTCAPEQVGRLAGSLVQALAFVSTQPLASAYVGEVRTRAHLQSLVAYVLDQTTHHALTTADHPALWEGSSFRDLVGARLIEGFRLVTLREMLPRLTRREVWGAVGLEPVEPAGDAALAAVGAVALADAARACLAVADLRGLEPQVLAARRVVAHLAELGGARRATIAQALGVSLRAVQRARLRPEDAPLERAVRLEVALRAACGGVRIGRTPPVVDPADPEWMRVR